MVIELGRRHLITDGAAGLSIRSIEPGTSPAAGGATSWSRWHGQPAGGRSPSPQAGPCCTQSGAGYHAPSELTVGPGTRVVGALFSAVADGIAAVDVPSAGEAGAPDFDRIRDEFAFIGDDVAVLKCFLLWATLVGSISLEVFGQYGADTLTNPVDVFDGQLRLLVAALETSN